MDKKVKNKAAKEIGQLGGRKTAQRHGKQHFSEAGKKGAAKRWGKRKEEDGSNDKDIGWWRKAI